MRESTLGGTLGPASSFALGHSLGQPSQRERAVLLLAAALADPHAQPAGTMQQPDRAIRGVDVLTPGPAAASEAPLELAGIDLEPRGDLDMPLDPDRGEPSLASAAMPAASIPSTVIEQLVRTE